MNTPQFLLYLLAAAFLQNAVLTKSAVYNGKYCIQTTYQTAICRRQQKTAGTGSQHHFLIFILFCCSRADLL